MTDKPRILIIAPHPDDGELGMGGSIIKLARQGHYVHLLDMTNGEPHVRTYIKRVPSARCTTCSRGVSRLGGACPSGLRTTIDASRLRPIDESQARHAFEVHDVVRDEGKVVIERSRRDQQITPRFGLTDIEQGGQRPPV